MQRVVGRQSEHEWTAGVVDADAELVGKILNGVGRFDVGLAAVERDRIAFEVEDEDLWWSFCSM